MLEVLASTSIEKVLRGTPETAGNTPSALVLATRVVEEGRGTTEQTSRSNGRGRMRRGRERSCETRLADGASTTTFEVSLQILEIFALLSMYQCKYERTVHIFTLHIHPLLRMSRQIGG